MKKKSKYRRITWTDRLKIEALFNAKHTYQFIANELGFVKSAIYNEVQHGLYDHLDGKTWLTVQRYSATIAQQHTDWQVTIKGAPLKLGNHYDFAQYAAERIKAGDSPDVIVHALKRENKWTVSTSTLYRYIEKGYISGITSKDLQEKPTRKPRKPKEKKKAARPPRGTSIERRPEEIATRETFGHWEQDTVVGKSKGKKQVILVLTERKTRYEIIVKLWDKSCKSVIRAFDSILSKYPQGTFKTITVDNGCEFQDCNRMEHNKRGEKRLDVYYCHPYRSTERATNERANRIIRRFFPKGVSFAKYTSKDCQRVQDWMNNYPRKILDYSTPAELFQKELEKLF